METRHIRFLHEVATQGSVTGAARRLGLTQSALTKIVARIEDEFGAKLFDRTARGVTPNAFGRVFLGRARRIGIEMEDLTNEIRTMRSGLSGSIALGSGQAWLSRILPSAIAHCHTQFPQLEVRVRTGQFEELMSGLWRGDLDFLLAQVRPIFNDPDLEIEPISDTVLMATARKGHPMTRRRRPLTIQMLAEFPWIAPPIGDPARDHLARVFVENGSTGPEVAVETSSFQLAARLLLETDMLSFLPDMRTTVYGKHLVALQADWCTHRRSAGIVTLRDRARTTAVRNFIEILRDATQPETPQEPITTGG